MAEQPPDIVADEILDLTGRICPMTFVYTKVTLERMMPGQVLQVVLDYPPAFKNVPESVATQNLGEVVGEFGDTQIRIFWIKKS